MAGGYMNPKYGEMMEGAKSAPGEKPAPSRSPRAAEEAILASTSIRIPGDTQFTSCTQTDATRCTNTHMVTQKAWRSTSTTIWRWRRQCARGPRSSRDGWSRGRPRWRAVELQH